ncbi:MAG: hypothetical protein IMZ66_12390 [Planctomycetes bacterium]|nr:hypothetical protein [Planctomycetota bacterium]
MAGIRVVALLAVLAAPLATLALEDDAPSQAEPGDALWQAIVAVESGGDAAAYNAHDGATGIAQIRMVCLADVNRIAKIRGLAARFSPSDRRKPEAARRIWNLYLDYYGNEYQQATGREPTDEVYARIWNGGPTGWRKASTADYWGRVRAALQ